MIIDSIKHIEFVIEQISPRLWDFCDTQSATGKLKCRGCITALPQGGCYINSYNMNCDARSLDIPDDAGSVWFYLINVADESTVAEATFAGDSSFVRCDEITVMPEYRRMGIATFLYKQASGVFEAPVVPSSNLFQDGLAFWGGKTQIMHD